MEDYELYYKKQKADSNCGFAEEFEVRHKLNIHVVPFLIQLFAAGGGFVEMFPQHENKFCT